MTLRDPLRQVSLATICGFRFRLYQAPRNHLRLSWEANPNVPKRPGERPQGVRRCAAYDYLSQADLT